MRMKIRYLSYGVQLWNLGVSSNGLWIKLESPTFQFHGNTMCSGGNGYLETEYITVPARFESRFRFLMGNRVRYRCSSSIVGEGNANTSLDFVDSNGYCTSIFQDIIVVSYGVMMGSVDSTVRITDQRNYTVLGGRSPEDLRRAQEIDDLFMSARARRIITEQDRAGF